VIITGGSGGIGQETARVSGSSLFLSTFTSYVSSSAD
jgi:short-subunit dehydrogenase